MFSNRDSYKTNDEDLKNLSLKNAAKNIVSVINYVAKGKKKFFQEENYRLRSTPDNIGLYYFFD